MDDLDASPFAAFVMSEFHAPEVEAIVRREEHEATAALGHVRCTEQHGWEGAGYGDDFMLLPLAPACPACGAAL